MKIAFYKWKYGNSIDKLIGITSFSKYSHVELIFSDGLSGSASPRDGGVRLKEIDYSKNPDHWDIFELCDDYSEGVIKYWFALNEGDKYDYIGAIGSLFNIDLTNEDKKFCSYCIGIVLGYDPINTPGGLYKALVNEGKLCQIR